MTSESSREFVATCGQAFRTSNATVPQLLNYTLLEASTNNKDTESLCNTQDIIAVWPQNATQISM